jgi:D-alanyl-lipoteichoic acid acyltransferase DltB (MBOAT superfamily)
MTAVIFFTFQLYIDFSAYSEIAIGSARMMGFRLSRNFRRPLLAESFQDLWARWHISLTTWFRDYVFRPLRNLPGGRNRRVTNVLIVFFLTGLWHGADWTFVIWGVLNGLYLLLLDTTIVRQMRKIPAPFSRIIRTMFCTVFMYTALILFRAPDMAVAGEVFLALFDWDLSQLDVNSVRLGMVEIEWWMSWMLLVGLYSLECMVEANPSLESFFSQGIGLKRWLVTWVLAMAIILLGSYGLNVLDQEFIYFQF